MEKEEIKAREVVPDLAEIKPKKSKKIAKTPQEIADSFGVIPKEVKRFLNKQYFTSKTQRGECKNNSCLNPRRQGSAYCQACSDKHKKENQNGS